MKCLATIRPQLKIVFALLVLTSVAYGQEIAKLERFVQSTKVNTAAMQIFREGRDLIEAQNWQRAAEKFNEFIKAYPKDRDLDAALYWYGYALQKQQRKEEAAEPLLLLIRRFPNSSWRREADALLVVLGREAEVKEALEKDNCEIKILALQSLFQADEERAIQIVTDSLKANPGQCEGFQAAAISILGRRGSGARAVPILLTIARNNADLKLRVTAIRLLGDQHTEQVTDELIKLYDADRNRDIRAQIVRALAESGLPRGNAKVLEIARTDEDQGIRELAIRSIGSMKDPAALDELMRIYDSTQTMQIRSYVVRALFERREDPRARTKVWEIARKDPAPELRSYAIRNLFADHEEQTITQFIGLYDAEQSQMVKTVLIRAFGESKHKVGLQKLMTIARSDPSLELRKVAIRYLGQSKDPDALRLLEELLK